MTVTDTKMMMEEGKRVLARLEEAGYSAFFVGGCVRDLVSGRPIHDVDLASSAPPEKAIELFPDALATGLKHGTITVRQGGCFFELTTFRKETEYKDHRRPDGVEFVSEIEEDLRRRDFTMNAMAMDRHGVLLDPFQGAADLEQGILRAVGEPDERFREDALRMLRCIRFAANYKLSVEENTWLALLANARLLRHIAMERVRSEVVRMIEGPYPVEGLRLLSDSRLLRYTKERLDMALRDWTANELPPVLLTLDGLASELRLLLLAKVMELSASQAEALWRTMTFSVKEGKRTAAFLGADAYLARELGLAARHAKAIASDEAAPLFKRAVLLFAEEAMQDWLAIARHFSQHGLPIWADATLPSVEALLQEGEDWLRQMPAKRMEELAVNGGAIQASLDRKPGPWLGKLMKHMLEEVAVGELPNEENALLDWACKRAQEITD
ncbi:CCA tRNA nucleotidyltransferase [Gorillibacterium sp. CAU 1737]|uniref:CCA tRNA nucleotidyltransferase n=1 Tax=Gorillibacterium sp. CAU 1737 TaxID=3140362 RepID=UPI0032611797